MRIAELSRRTGVSVPTIKYYLREGLLMPGERTSPNQARYQEEHIRRLRLIRALVDVGGMSVGQVGDVLAAVDASDENVHNVLGVVQKSITTPRDTVDEVARGEALGEVEELIERHEWRVKLEGPAAQALAVVIVSLRQLGHNQFVELLDVYAEAAKRIASAELAMVAKAEKVEDLVESVVVGTVLGDAAIAAIRRMAHVDASSRLFEGNAVEAEGEPGEQRD